MRMITDLTLGDERRGTIRVNTYEGHPKLVITVTRSPQGYVSLTRDEVRQLSEVEIPE